MDGMKWHALGVLALSVAGAWAQPGQLRPVPNDGVIDRPGAYVLLDNRMLRTPDGVGISITASNVSVDLNGHTISGFGGKMGTGVRIQGVAGVKVYNGGIANMAFGVSVMMSNNVVLRGLRIRGEGLTVTAPPPETGIMIGQSRNVVVEDNALYNVGLGIFVRGGNSWGNRIANNTITAGTNGILGICYNPADGDPEGPRGDTVYNNSITGFGTGVQASATSRTNLFKGNFIWYTTGVAVDLQNSTNVDMDNFKARLP